MFQCLSQENLVVTAPAISGNAENAVLIRRRGILVQTSGFGLRKHFTTARATFSGDCMSQEGEFCSKSDSLFPLRVALEAKNSVRVPIGCTVLTKTLLFLTSIRID